MKTWLSIDEASQRSTALGKPLNRHQLLSLARRWQEQSRGRAHCFATAFSRGTPKWHVDEAWFEWYMENEYTERILVKTVPMLPPASSPSLGTTISKEAKDAGEVRRRLEERLEARRLMKLLENGYE